MTDQTRFYVGYARLEDLLETHERASPLYLAAPSEARTTDTVGFAYRYAYLVVSDVQDRVARYWRFALGRAAEHGGAPMEAQEFNRLMERARQAEQVLRRILRERFEVNPERAIVTLPLDLRLLEGDTDLIAFDRATQQFAATTP